MKIHNFKNSSFVRQLLDVRDEKKGTLIRFKNGKLYKTSPTLKDGEIHDFVNDPSAGEFYNKRIKPFFEMRPVDEFYVNIGVTEEHIDAGTRVEVNLSTGFVRKLQLPKLK